MEIISSRVRKGCVLCKSHHSKISYKCNFPTYGSWWITSEHVKVRKDLHPCPARLIPMFCKGHHTKASYNCNFPKHGSWWTTSVHVKVRKDLRPYQAILIPIFTSFHANPGRICRSCLRRIDMDEETTSLPTCLPPDERNEVILLTLILLLCMYFFC